MNQGSTGRTEGIAEPQGGHQGSEAELVEGERGSSAVDRARSAQSRVSGILAAGLMICLAVGLLTWYYSHAMTRQTRARQTAQAAAKNHAQGEMPLPSLGNIERSRQAGMEAVPKQTSDIGTGALDFQQLPELPLSVQAQQNAGSPIVGGAYASVSPAYENPAAKTAAQLVMERRLSGAAFASSSADSSVPPMNTGPIAGYPADSAADGAPPVASAKVETASTSEMATLLHPARVPTAQAKVLPAQRLLLPKGAFIDCTLETAIDSTLPGMTTCVTATDTFGVDGKVVLLERGTKLIGETRGQVQQGSARVFVLWAEARTPTGVVIPLDSPGTDELGRSGLPGKVNRHFWERFGAAILISTLDGAIQGVVQSKSDGAVIYNPSTSQEIMTEVLKSTISIPPTITKHNGDRIQVLVARDLDFRTVYELRALNR